MSNQVSVAESEERKKTECEESMRSIRKSILDLQYEWDEATVDRAEAALEHAQSLSRIAEAHEAYLEAKIWHIEAESDIQGLKDRNISIMERLEEEKRLLAAETQAVAEAKETAQLLGHECQLMMSEKSEEWRQEVMANCDDRSAEQVQQEMEAEEAKLELIHAANPNVIREFERRATEIERLRKKMSGSQEKLQRLAGAIEELMEKWEPKLDELVSKINDAFAHNFEQINCAGEVRVHRDEDFDSWAMEIMVKFRYVHIHNTPFTIPPPFLTV